ncbi:MAG: hypothetical protein ABL959_09950 [Pyrinomonadaceae bacterium]
MENFTPGFLLSAGTTAVIVIAWLVRGEFQSRANAARQKEFEEASLKREALINEYVDEVRDEHKEVKRAFYAHVADSKVHHNEEMFKEFRTGLERRFSSIDSTLQEISRKLDDRRTSPGIHSTQS